MLTPKRIYVEELLDAGAGADKDVAENLSDLRRINRFLGGQRVVMKALAAHLAESRSERFSLLDVGTGSADIPGAISKWARARGIETIVCALDVSERNLRVARGVLGVAADLRLVRGDARLLPFPDRSFDFVTASLFLHHFHDEDAVMLLAEFRRVARRAVIVNDLTRNLVPYYFIKLLGPLFTDSFLTRHDGPVSVLRGFTRTELRGLARLAGMRRFEVTRIFPYRLLLVANGSDANDERPR